MRINFSKLSAVAIAMAIATGFSTDAIAKPAKKVIQPQPNETLAETFNRAYFANDPDFFTNRNFNRQIEWMFGFSGFTENEINRDAKQVHNLYQAALERQVASDVPIRTPDLPNPYETSILSSPALDVNQDAQQ